jgi:hypothetical protein
MSCNSYLSMSEHPILPFSVARFTIEGDGEGTRCTQPVHSSPPRLSHSQKLLFAVSHSLFDRFSIPNAPASVSSTLGQISPEMHTALQPIPSKLSSASLSNIVTPFSNAFYIDLQNSSSIPLNTVAFNTPDDLHTLQSSNFLQKPSVLPSFILPTPSQSTLSSSPKIADAPVACAHQLRKVQADQAITQSPYWPCVSTVDRIFSWRTPYGLSHDRSLLSKLPLALVKLAKMSITGALAGSTRSTYASGILRFNQFCDKWNITEGAHMPASYGLLCVIIGEYKGTISGKTIRSWLSGIHLANHAQWSGDDKWVQMACTSANKEGSHHKRLLHAPVSIEHLLALRRAISLSDSFHASVWAIALVTFFGCHRLGETTVLSPSAFDARYHASRSTVYVYFYCCLFYHL